MFPAADWSGGLLKVYADKVAPTQNKNEGSPFFDRDNDVIC